MTPQQTIEFLRTVDFHAEAEQVLDELDQGIARSTGCALDTLRGKPENRARRLVKLRDGLVEMRNGAINFMDQLFPQETAP